ncbi:uncharacterized protein LOC130891220 isoform X1 [Diorhabda carinulata]|uniref:uncharacterized protein LOC130891220 isoform X1 n=2 Tax=Diorhabda carinulata TaxID=1163345 RepID=UPI0025A1102E|nr:uncharacterized protein LOC130891220 isoform X1 [Diorhabda carinulata]
MHLMMLILFLVLIVSIATATELNLLPAVAQYGNDPQYHPILSLYHSQDKLGHYVYGYATPSALKSEKLENGVTRGGYSYIDSNGYLQTVQYIVDPVHGFRVAATNLPQDLPDVAWAKEQHIAQYEAIKSENAKLATAIVAYSNPIAVPIGAVPNIPPHQQLPQPVNDLPEVVKARNEHLAILNAAYAKAIVSPALPESVKDLPEVIKARAEHLAAVEEIKTRDASISKQISLSNIPEAIKNGVIPVKTVTNTYVTPAHAVVQTEEISYNPVASESKDFRNFGKYSYGYVGPHSAHSESRSEDGVTRGGYSYIDANGRLQNVHYIADANHGFRVAASNLPVDPHHSRNV